MILRLHTVNILPQSFYSSYHSKMAAIALESLSFLSFKFGFTNLIFCVNLFKKKKKNKEKKKKKEKKKRRTHCQFVFSSLFQTLFLCCMLRDAMTLSSCCAEQKSL